MSQFRWSWIVTLCVAFATFGAGCTSMRECRACCCDAGKGPKTLLKWESKEGKEKDKKSDDKDEKSEKDGDKKNGDKTEKDEPKKPEEEEKPKEDDKPKPLDTDRPDFTEATTTVGKGRIQLEAGYTYTKDRADGITTHSHSYPEMLLRIGVFADWFELRIGQNFGDERDISPTLIQSRRGAEDLYLGTKLALTEQKKCLPETAIILQTMLPTGHEDFTAHQVLPGVNYLFGWEIIEGVLSCGGSLQANRAVDGISHYYTEAAESFTVGYMLTKKLRVYTEWYALFPSGAIDPAVGPQHYMDGGFAYRITDNFQVDILAGVGLNRHADDFYVGSGFAVRY